MCGIVGVVSVGSGRLSVSRDQALRMREALSRRGPDGAGEWVAPWGYLGHRRLAILDTSEAGAQPMSSPDGRFVLAYNGELYNDLELRRELGALGDTFRSRSDAETLLMALRRWGSGAMQRLRGMYAFAFIDTWRKVVLLGRDPLGIKPLLLWFGPVPGGFELAFASEYPALFAHPHIPRRPNLLAISAYLATIRTHSGADTLFEGVLTLRPGEWIEVDASGPSPHADSRDWWQEAPEARDASAGVQPTGDPVADTRAHITDSVRRHLRSDVPVAGLLSGGLDSSIVCAVARREIPSLHTFCVGAREVGEAEAPDFAAARLAAESLGTRHEEVELTREAFVEHWPRMVRDLGRPLSTPNEVAIFSVAQIMRQRGFPVALSGEGADELFGGYHESLDALATSATPDRGAAALDVACWLNGAAKQTLLNHRVCEALDGDAEVYAFYRREYALVSEQCSPGAGHAPSPDLDIQLALQRRINLAGLLDRLDGAMMLVGVEGRTPFADQGVARFAEGLPMAEKYVPPAPRGGAARGAVSTLATAPPVSRTKICLRLAFTGDVPPEILARPKASFPVPFQRWAADLAPRLTSSPLVRELFKPAAIAHVASRPVELWNFAWPMINLALWGDLWWT